MAWKPVDALLGSYALFFAAVVLARGPLSDPGNALLLAACAGFAAALFLLAARGERTAFGRALHDLYPLVVLLPLYAALGFLNRARGEDVVLANDQVVQAWESAVFGGQVSFAWIREAPSVFWSGLFHAAYFTYYPIIVVGPLALVFRGRRAEARNVLLATMAAFVACFVVFVCFPVAGPYYAFEHPTGPVREVWSARFVYWLLSLGSSLGTAFPSSHVAAATAAVVALWRAWKPLSRWLVLPALLLTISIVYCQMHYAVDALAGLGVGLGAAWAVAPLEERRTRAVPGG